VASDEGESPISTKAMCLRSRLAQQLDVFRLTCFMRLASQTSALVKSCRGAVGALSPLLAVKLTLRRVA